MNKLNTYARLFAKIESEMNRQGFTKRSLYLKAGFKRAHGFEEIRHGKGRLDTVVRLCFVLGINTIDIF